MSFQDPTDGYEGDIRERPLRITVSELNELKNRGFHNGLVSAALTDLQAAQRFRGVIPYPELQDEIEQRGQALADELADLITRYGEWANDFRMRNSHWANGLYADDRTVR